MQNICFYCFDQNFESHHHEYLGALKSGAGVTLIVKEIKAIIH